ncbi:bolA-like protein 3 isoform X2 [Paramacrobiotus metropolitanus]|uniref:bolA-like protein 3 isoform X2 n=1 Tax=Paramacrobiotus metropolitanus TaxID=2943436 RepID=UPI0024457672|nr:bolA-like protein 3 isoform X2 [Paramacrobiotus metropolitanus]
MVSDLPDLDCLELTTGTCILTEDAMSEGERHITSLLQSNFPEATEIDVRDVSGGCGTMYQIYIEAEEFRGKKLVDQQRMVNKVLEKEIKDMHGLSLQTVVPVK